MLISTFLSSSYAFHNPVRAPGADPSVVTVRNVYYMTVTYGDKIAITRSSTLEGLQTGETRTVWTDDDATRNIDMWAPEMHRIDGRWYKFYSSGGANTSDRYRVLRGCTAAAPFDCLYSYLADLTPPTGKQAGPNKTDPQNIDGTYLKIPGWGRYHVVSAVDDVPLKQAIQITKLNTRDGTVSGCNVISRPIEPWERNSTGSSEHNAIFAVNEGPHVSIRASIFAFLRGDFSLLRLSIL